MNPDDVSPSRGEVIRRALTILEEVNNARIEADKHPDDADKQELLKTREAQLDDFDRRNGYHR